MNDNLAAAEVSLSDDEMRRLDQVSAAPLGFPHEMLAVPACQHRIMGGKRALIDLPAQPVR